MKVTIKDIAKEAGVSVSTVSYVVNKTGPVSKEKREKVQKLIDKYNYQPNILARNLKKQRSKTIGVVFNVGHHGPDKKIIEAISTCCDMNDYNILLVAHKKEPTDTFRFLVENRVEGVIFIGNFTHIHDFPLPKDLPIVFSYGTHKDRMGYSVLPNDEKGGAVAAQVLIDAGCKKLAMITGNTKWQASKKRTEGFVNAAKANNTEIVKIVNATFEDVEYHYGQASLLFEGSQIPDGIFCHSDVIAFSVYHVLQDKNIQIGKDIKVIGFDDDPYCSFLRPSLTSISMPLFEMGVHSAELLFQAIENKEVDSDTPMLLPCELIERDSTK